MSFRPSFAHLFFRFTKVRHASRLTVSVLLIDPDLAPSRLPLARFFPRCLTLRSWFRFSSSPSTSLPCFAALDTVFIGVVVVVASQASSWEAFLV